MADSGKVRLVRCPKCENLLPELADYSVYQCGGCGAVLRGTLPSPFAFSSFTFSLLRKLILQIEKRSEKSSYFVGFLFFFN